MAIINSALLSSNIPNTEGGKVQVTTQSNSQRTNKVDTDIIVEKYFEKSWALKGEEVKVTTKITNNMDINLEDFSFHDTLSSGASFVENSLQVGSVKREELNPFEGFDLSVTIGGSGGEVEISYNILVDELPQVEEITSQTTIVATISQNEYTLTSPIGKLTLLNNDVVMLKSANTTAVKSGDEITYTITITNSGKLDNTELIFTDNIPTGTTFIADSVKVNSQARVGENPQNGISLPDLPANGEISVEFSVRVT